MKAPRPGWLGASAPSESQPHFNRLAHRSAYAALAACAVLAVFAGVRTATPPMPASASLVTAACVKPKPRPDGPDTLCDAASSAHPHEAIAHGGDWLTPASLGLAEQPFH